MATHQFRVYFHCNGHTEGLASVRVKNGTFRALKDELISAHFAIESDFIAVQVNGEDSRTYKDDERLPEQKGDRSMITIRPARAERGVQASSGEGRQIITLLTSIESQLRSGTVTTGKPANSEQVSQSEPSSELSLLHGEYTWKIKYVDQLPEKYMSEVFDCAGHLWQLYIFPSGNEASQKSSGEEDNKRKYLSAYLTVPDSERALSGQRYTKFELILHNSDPTKHHKKSDTHNFNKKGETWGWSQFAAQEWISNPAKGFLHRDMGICLKVKMTVCPF